MSGENMKNITTCVLLFIIIISFIGVIITFQYKEPGNQGIRLKKFSSYYELRSFIEENLETTHSYYSPDIFLLDSSREALTASSPEYSTTNVQVESVDEADIVKTDGKYIYVVSGKNVFIVKAYPPEEAEVLSKIEFNGTITGIYINKYRLIVFESNLEFLDLRESEIYIKIYDVSDRRTPVLKGNISLNEKDNEEKR